METIIVGRSDVVILGDFNIDYSSKRKTSLRKKLDEFALQHNLKQIVKSPTRITEASQTTIDLFFTNSSDRIVECDVIHSSISDHSLIFGVIKGGVRKVPPKVLEYRSFKSYDKTAFLKDLHEVPWNVIESVDDVNDAVFLWEKLFKNTIDEHAPIKVKRIKGNRTPWITTQLLEVRRDRDYHLKRAHASNSKYHWSMYRKLRNAANTTERDLKSKYYCKLIEEAKNDGSKMWKAIKETLPSKSSGVSSIYNDGKLLCDSKSIAEVMNDHFAKMGKTLAKAFGYCKNARFQDYPIDRPTKNFSFEKVNPSLIEIELKKLKVNKAIGLDKISARLLRDASEVIAPSLCYLFNLSFETGTFPTIWKCAKVSALFKQGKRTDKDNYRPISVLPIISKVLEKVAHIQLYSFLDSNDVLTNKQFGFRRGRSTSLALTQFIDEVLGNLDRTLYTGVIFLDLRKAFDTVDHQILIYKLKSIGVTNKNLSWFHSYLTSRCQKTVIGQSISKTEKVKTGVPQGSILGPLLFTIYVNNLPTCLKNSNVTLFADDTAIYYSDKSTQELQEKLNEDLREIGKWLFDHKLSLNLSKTKVMLVGGPKKLKAIDQFALTLNESTIERIQSYKYLGLMINESLTWTDHVDYISQKVMKRLGILKRIKHLLPRSARKLLVTTTILPVLDYADIVWGDKSNKTQMERIQILHNKAAKIILDKSVYASATEALNELGWKTMDERRKLHRLSFIHKVVNNVIEWDFHISAHQDIHGYNTRNKSSLKIPASRTNWGTNRLMHHGLQEWNALPENTRNIVNFKTFRNTIRLSI